MKNASQEAAHKSSLKGEDERVARVDRVITAKQGELEGEEKNTTLSASYGPGIG